MKGIVNVPGASGADIAAHNASPEAHPDIRDELKTLEDQPSKLDEMISEHNSDKSAHEDIRQDVEKLVQDLNKWPEIKRREVTLTTQGWSAEEKTQTVTVTGVSAKETDQLIIPAPAGANREAYQEAGIQATAQEADRVTFTAWAIPEEDLTVYVTIIPYGGGADK